MSDNEWFADAADFLLVLVSLSIPFIGAGTFDSTKLEGARLFPNAIKPAALNLHPTVTGHSSGEIGAAYATGLLSLREAIIIAYYRGLYLGEKV
ncbi:hypothetical protein V8E54_001058 [Elaphomyces granulatus]